MLLVQWHLIKYYRVSFLAPPISPEIGHLKEIHFLLRIIFEFVSFLGQNERLIEYYNIHNENSE